MALCAGLAAAELPPDVLTQSSRATLTRADVETDLESVPADRRAEFAANPGRLGAVVNALLEVKTLAAEARASGLDKDPLVQRRVALQVERVLAIARRDQIERDAGAEFDRRRDEFVVRAREIYAVEKARFTVPEQVRAAHILVKTDRRGNDEALKLAKEIRARALAGEGGLRGARARILRGPDRRGQWRRPRLVQRGADGPRVFQRGRSR